MKAPASPVVTQIHTWAGTFFLKRTDKTGTNKVYKEVLYLDKNIDGNAHWINDLHSDSMTYITLINEIEKEEILLLDHFNI